MAVNLYIIPPYLSHYDHNQINNLNGYEVEITMHAISFSVSTRDKQSKNSNKNSRTATRILYIVSLPWSSGNLPGDDY